METKSIFLEFFGDYPISRVLDFLLTFRDFDYNKKDIAKNANVSWNTLETFFWDLEQKEVVVRTRKVGKSQMFKLNEKNQIVKELLELNKVLMLQSIQNLEEKAVVKVHNKRQ